MVSLEVGKENNFCFQMSSVILRKHVGPAEDTAGTVVLAVLQTIDRHMVYVNTTMSNRRFIQHISH